MPPFFFPLVSYSWLPFRQLVRPDLHGWGHSFGVGYIQGQLEQQGAQISYEVYKMMHAARNDARGISNVHSGQPLHYSPEPLPVVVWDGLSPAPVSEPEQDPQF